MVLFTATKGKSNKNVLDAAIWLPEPFVKPRKETVEGDSSAAMKYLAALDNAPDLDPMSIVAAGVEGVEATRPE